MKPYQINEENERRKLFISLALSVKLALNSSRANEINVTQLYEKVCEQNIDIKQWNTWLFEQMYEEKPQQSKGFLFSRRQKK